MARPYRIYSDEERRLRRNAASAAYKKRNPEKVLERRKNYYLSNRELIKENRRTYYSNNKENFKLYSLKYKDANHEALLYRAARLRAKKSGMEFNIDITDVIIPDKCPVYGFKLIRSRDKSAYNSATLDRIDNSLGYIKGNIQVISYRANTLKKDATIDEIEKLYFYMKKTI